jgi:hypothetical protein
MTGGLKIKDRITASRRSKKEEWSVSSAAVVPKRQTRRQHKPDGSSGNTT